MSPRRSGLERGNRDTKDCRREDANTGFELAGEKRRLERLSQVSEKSSSKLRGEVSRLSGDIASEYRTHLDEKRRPADLERTKNEAKSEREADGSEKQNAKGNRMSDTRVMPLNDALREAKQIQQDRAEIARTSRFPRERARGKDVKMYHEIDYYQPQVRGVRVKSYEHLREIVDKDFPGCKRIEGFDKMMEGARKHFELGDRLEGKKYLGYGDVARFARELDVGATTVVNQAVRGKPSRIYLILDSAISKSEGLVLVERMIQENNGIKDMGDIDRRLGCYYAEREYRSSRNYNKDLEMAGKYFKYLDLLKEGGSLTENSRQLGIGWGDLGSWNKGHAPWVIQLASSIPDRTPKEGCVWLPTVTESKNNPGGFIEVPLKVTSFHQIEGVLTQITSLDNEDIRKLEKQFGPSSKVDSFMYTLGTLLSDGSAQLATDSNLASSRLQQPLGRSYDWSITYGEGTRYHISKIGIRMNRQADREYNPNSVGFPSSGAHDWGSQRSPLITWMRRSCLGLKDTDSKTYDSIDAQWILSAPEEWRTPFLQGLCDGDGCASIKSQYLSIATASNTEFCQDFLKSFGVQSHEGDGAVVIGARESVKKMHEIGMFRYALSRKENLGKLVKMHNSIDYTQVLSNAEMEHVKTMRKNGKSWGSISESLFDGFGRTLPYYSIQRRYEKEEDNRKESAQPN